MNTTLLRYILSIVLFGTTVIGRAQNSDYIVNETFEDFPDGYYSSYNGWTLFGCQKGWIGNKSQSHALHIEKNEEGGVAKNGYAITKALGYEGDVYLTFRYATGKGSLNSPQIAKVRVIIQGDGTFENGNKDTLMTFNNPSSSDTIKNAAYRVLNAAGTTQIKFYQGLTDQSVVIDNVKIRKSYSISLDETEDNSSTISSYLNKYVSAATTRTLTGGIWNTMCLPFRVYESVLKLALGDNQDIQIRTYSGYNAGVMSFSTAKEVPAGTPFLIKINETVTNPTFPVVTIKETTAKTETHGDVSFKGTYSPVDLSTDGTNLFLTTRNTLASPASGKNTMNGLRAYIVVPEGFDSSNARILMDDGETTAISDLAPSAETSPQATYNLKGQRVENVRRGLYVVNGKLTLVK